MFTDIFHPRRHYCNWLGYNESQINTTYQVNNALTGLEQCEQNGHQTGGQEKRSYCLKDVKGTAVGCSTTSGTTYSTRRIHTPRVNTKSQHPSLAYFLEIKPCFGVMDVYTSIHAPHNTLIHMYITSKHWNLYVHIYICT